MPSTLVPEGHDMFFCGGFATPTPAPGGWGGSGTESTLGLDPLPLLSTPSPASASQACAVMWRDGTVDISAEFTTRTNNPGQCFFRVYRASPQVAPTSATLVGTDTVTPGGGGLANSISFSVTGITVTDRDRLLFSIEHTSTGPGVAWGNINIAYQ